MGKKALIGRDVISSFENVINAKKNMLEVLDRCQDWNLEPRTKSAVHLHVQPWIDADLAASKTCVTAFGVDPLFDARLALQCRCPFCSSTQWMG
jgi:hypothetical protein